MSRLTERPAPDASTLLPPSITCSCGRVVDMDRGYLGVQHGDSHDPIACALFNCACGSTRGYEVYSVVRAGLLARLT